MIENHSVSHRNCSRANAYAAIEQANRLPAKAPTTTIAELIMYWLNGYCQRVPALGVVGDDQSR